MMRRRNPWSLWLFFIVALSAGACARILGFEDREPREFPHRAHAVAGINCARCHGDVVASGEEAELHLPDEGSCASCHSEPDDPNACFDCFTLPSTHRRVAERKHHLLFSHAVHREAVYDNCASCHLGVTGEGDSVGASMATCLGCHEHRDEFRTRECESCHRDLHEEVAMPATHLVHDGDFLRRHGVQAANASDLCATCHQENFCASCHGATTPALPSRLNMGDPMRAGMHRAGFMSRHAMEARMDPGLCTTCHSPQTCANCHARSDIRLSGNGALSPHPAGWVGALGSENAHGRAARLDPVSCASCHGGAGETLCVSCHAVGGVGGSPHPPGFDSRLGLEEMPCRMCHSAAGAP